MSTRRSLSKPKLLFIDDDPAVTTAISMRLQSYNVEVLTAFFGTQGIWLAATRQPDAIVTDMRMPSGGGDFVVECLKRRSDTRHLPVIVLTGCRDRDRERQMLTLGVDHYLHKPTKVDVLLSTLRRYVNFQRLPA